MVRLKLEAADIFRRHGARWRAANGAHLGLAQRRVMTAIEKRREDGRRRGGDLQSPEMTPETGHPKAGRDP